MSHRPLVFVLGLTGGDYLLWNWSLNNTHDVLALVSGLTLPPLAVACVWLLALSVARILASTARRTPARSKHRHRRPSRRRRGAAASSAVEQPTEQTQAPGVPDGAPPRKIAA